MELGAVVLAGGKSSRMGKTKWLLQAGGKSVLQHVILGLEGTAEQITVALPWGADQNKALRSTVMSALAGGDDGRDLMETGAGAGAVRFIVDTEPFPGPLAGMEAGFKAHTQEWCAAVAADMPFVRAELLTALLQAGATADADAALPEFGGRLHPLFAVYRRSEALRTLTKFRAQGGRKVLDWLAGMRVTVLPEADVRRIDPEGLSLFNMNTPEDYDWVRARLGDRGV